MNEAQGPAAAHGVFLRFFVQEKQRVHGVLVYDWLLDTARQMDIRGGSALRVIAGYGRHRILHESHFIELQGELPIEVDFIASEEEAQHLLTRVKAEQLSLFYVKIPAEFGIA
ncbi:DUF190 domain-containing protein [Paludibacterium yongneupense]|uniref:DUF190 domain-containing protein n=1 Tax=Paludibacterium yongneupense TaxID=400061 RepID=UPI000400A094|nr:DUF190 domain-containing protein [Paludibacterium yongneupense]